MVRSLVSIQAKNDPLWYSRPEWVISLWARGKSQGAYPLARIWLCDLSVEQDVSTKETRLKQARTVISSSLTQRVWLIIRHGKCCTHHGVDKLEDGSS
jgi:hypothetical protein